MAIETRTSISKTQVVLPKHDVEPAGSTGHSKQDGQREQAKQREKRPDSHPISNYRGQMTGVFIDVTV
ncbi:MAG: hypothetical protein NT159_02705 [Proteobacteria bacterium]|nr:hypothetical protein [Pseudomonadota bacterium]